MRQTTASEQLFGALGAFSRDLARLSMAELAVDVGLSAAIAVAAWGLGLGFRMLLGAGIRKLPREAGAERVARARRVARFGRRIVGLGLTVVAVLLIAQVWGVDFGVWLSRGLGERLARMATHVALLLVFCFAAIEFASFGVDRVLGDLTETARSRQRTNQLQTLAPLIRSSVRGVVLVVFAMMILSEAGVKIAPLLAGAGVVGIALGFGAQTMVKDLLTGVFLIVEDIVSVGDIVQIAGFGGLVEQMTLRTIRLRDFDGTLHVFPYGEAQVIHNLTKTFSYYVFDLQVAYEADIDRALDTIRRTGEELAADPAFKPRILAPIEVVGVDKLADSGVVLKARIKTQPAEQWTVGREYNRRIKLAFDRAGIEIPYPHLQVVVPPRLDATGAAGREAAE